MQQNNRIEAIDIMRGITLFLMLVITNLRMPFIPKWPECNTPDLGGWIFNSFLFIAGMVIPLSIEERISKGEETRQILKHIIKRAVSLIIIGILMINAVRVNMEFTGIGKNLWSLLMFTGIFLIWNRYTENERNFFTINGLRLAGIAILVVLVMIFKSGEFANNGSLITSWWGFPGIIGWGYLIAALIYTAIQNNILNAVIAWLFFLVLTIVTNLGLLSSFMPESQIFNVITDGYATFMLLSGVLTTVIFKNYPSAGLRKPLIVIFTVGITFLSAGLILNKLVNNVIILSTSWGITCSGISMILFILLYRITKIKNLTKTFSFLRYAGEISLTIYLVSWLAYILFNIMGVTMLDYRQTDSQLLSIVGSVIWSVAVIGLTYFITKKNIRLKI